MPKDYYEILGVSKNASSEEIKSAYRRLALKYHPDRGGGKAEEEKFKEINEAYQALSDPEKRAQYDRFGRVGTGAGPGGYSSWQGDWTGGINFGGFNFGGFSGLNDIFEEMFAGAFSTVQAEVTISPAQAVLGDRLSLQFEDQKVDLNIPAGTQDGQQFVFRGKGRPTKRGRGDLIISIRIKMPNGRRLSRTERELWEKLKNQSS